MLGGDFNIIRQASESNKKRCSRWTDNFNAIIEHWDLRDLYFVGRCFTWSNNRRDPVFEKLDRMLVSTECESKYPLVFVMTLPHFDSDHGELVVDIGLDLPKVYKPFKFELCWFLRPDIGDVVNKAWSALCRGKSFLDIWHNKMKNVGSKLKGWNINWEGFNKRMKKYILEQIAE